MKQSRHVRRDHAAAEPARVRAVPAVARARRDLRRRRSQRRRQPGAVRAARASTSPACRRTRSARRRSARSAPKACGPTRIVRGGSRIGIYFAEAGASQRASTVIYDRARSAISEMEPDAVDWATCSTGAAWFHTTGITPALGAKARRRHARALAGRESSGRAGQRGPQLPQEAVDREAGAGGDAAADEATSTS